MQFDFNNPYPSIRVPVFARNVVSTSHPLAAQAGLRMLWKGGNAVDAAIAAAAVMTLCEPCSNGLGSDAFAILWDGKQLHGLNSSGPAPAAWTPEYFRKKYGDDPKPPKRGIDSVSIPGAVASWVALSDKFGKLPFADLLEPAIDIAERGYLVPFIVQQKWAAAVPELKSGPGWAQAFMPKGRAPEVGELFQFKSAARALRLIAETKGKAFYGGEIAEAIAKFSKENGGVHTAEDFASFEPEWVETISKDYRGYTLHEIPPNGQGIAALIALGILENFDVAGMKADSADSQHLQIEAMKLAFADVYRYVAERKHMECTTEQMLDRAYLASRAKMIDMKRAQAFAPGNPVKGGTIYLTAADESGMMVSFIQSNYMGFGSGCVEPAFGISLQNRGHGFSLRPGANQVAPGKRPFHTIIPAFLTREGQPVMSFGVMGGNMQPQGHMQTLVRMIDYEQSPQAACDAPRWRFNAGVEINVEHQMDAGVVAQLRARAIRRAKATSPRRIRAATASPRASDRIAMERKKPRFIQHVGMKVDEAGPGFSRCSITIDDQHRNGTGVAHGGVLFTLADTAMGAALYSSLEKGEICATIEIKIGYFKPVFDGTLVCNATVVNKGKSIASLEATIHNGDQLVSKASGTFSIFRRKTDAQWTEPAVSD